ncbi:hypothetical protein H0H92_013788 [Tricholoma furcatifolium]|nr:hypothetical protein H0H92_013788 [Tricholoma furcatifolium]
MQEAEEQDTCRICSAPAEEGQPLFHPCKCSGTIRYIHQDCLTTWLSHSKKKNCDVCKHPYSFTKGLLACHHFISSLTSSPSLRIQYAIITTSLAVGEKVDSADIICSSFWRARDRCGNYLANSATMGDSVDMEDIFFDGRRNVRNSSFANQINIYVRTTWISAWWISGQKRPSSNANDESPFYYNLRVDESLPQPTTFFGRLTNHPVWAALSADIFTGQIIASLIVLTFVAVFLLREWISQNARPGVFDDDEILPEEGFPLRVELRPPVPPPPQPHPLEEALARRQAETLRALEELRDSEGANAQDDVEERQQRRARIVASRKGKAPRGKKNRFESDTRAVTRRRLLPEEEEDSDLMYLEERNKRKAFARRIQLARQASARRKILHAASQEFKELARGPLQVDPSFQFTFMADPPTPQMPPASLPFMFDGVKWVPANNDTIADSAPTSESLSSSQTYPSLETTSTPRPSSSSALPEFPSLDPYDAWEDSTHQPEAGPSRLTEPEPAQHHLADEMEEIEDEGADYDEYFGEPQVDVFPRAEPLSDDDSDREDHDAWRQYDEERPDTSDHEGEDEVPEPGEMEDFVFDAWEAADGEGGGHIEELGIDEALPEFGAVAQQPGDHVPNPLPGNEVPPELAEDMEANVEDDMEGAMEAIGMRGPIYGVLQNAALMIFVLDTAIGLGIWVPFTIGKTTALLSLDPPRFLQILHLPIRAIRIITDPFVDTSAFFLLEILLPSLKQTFLGSASIISPAIFWFFELAFGQKAVDGIVTGSMKLSENVAKLTTNPLEIISAWTASPSPVPQNTSAPPSFISKQVDYLIDLAEPYFAELGMRVRLTWVTSRITWTRLAVGDTPLDRTFAIALGYAVVGVILAFYLNLITVGNARTAGRAVRGAIRQQLLVLKVATFIFIELISFPLSCGIVLDLCTVWLFPEASFTTRITFLSQAPLTAVFYHWVAGTMFMYAFAVILSGCRSVMRPGAMWFIKDPQDANSHPIREILDRSTLTQLRKIFISGVMYSCVVACVVGSVAGLLELGSKSIMPFRWKNREPLSNVPVDLLFLHIVLPYTMHYFRPKKALKAATTVVWKLVAKQLRLTSYFFTGRYPEEERSIRVWSMLSSKTEADEKYIVDGAFRRVPATDNVVLPRDMPVTVAVTADGQALDEEATKLMTSQNLEVQRAGHNIKDEFIIVYIPPSFKYRILFFIAVIWVIGAFAMGIAVALPILLGRRFFEIFTTRTVHDGYSVIVGFYLLWGFYLLGSSIERLDRRRQRVSRDRHRGKDLPIVVLKRGAIWVAKSLYMALCLGVIIPTLISFVIDLYVVLPIRFTLDPGMTPRIRVVDTWALGLIYLKIALHANRIHAPNRFSRGIMHIMQNGWTRSDPVQATREVIGPVVGGLLGMILFPGFVFRVMQHFLPNLAMDNRFIFMHVYPGIFMLAGLVRSAVVLHGLLGSWSQSVRDKEFLVEMRLRNHEPEKQDSKYSDDEIATEGEEDDGGVDLRFPAEEVQGEGNMVVNGPEIEVEVAEGIWEDVDE